jgi:hypothetical protein
MPLKPLPSKRVDLGINSYWNQLISNFHKRLRIKEIEVRQSQIVNTAEFILGNSANKIPSK